MTGPRLLTSLLVLATGLVACGDGGDGGAAGSCGEDVQERVDPGSITHVLAGPPEPEYASDPPTSGPHQVGLVLSGVLDEPLSRPQQVGQLEAGIVLLQHGDLAPDDLAALGELAGGQVVVAPNPDLPATVVATAWTRKLVCDAVDAGALAALATFAAAHAGNGPGADG